MSHTSSHSALTHRDRFRRLMRFEPVDRLPVVEWAPYWDLTVDRWYSEGMPHDVQSQDAICRYFGLDDGYRQYWIRPRSQSFSGYISNAEEYERAKEHLYPDPAFDKDLVRSWAEGQESGNLVIWMTLEGFFWYPRTLFGIEQHLYAFYDQPNLMMRMNEDLCAFNERVINEFCEICTPDFMTFAEDLSYNHGPMLSKGLFDQFLAPFYRRLAPLLRDRGTKVIVDSDGDVHDLVDWFLDVGAEGFLPLERMAGVDIARLRQSHPDLLMIGAFDKTTMHLGEERMRQEFERLMPVMRQGGTCQAWTTKPRRESRLRTIGCL